MQAESMRDEVPFPGAWVLHGIYSEWDDDVSFPSFMLGLGGVFLLSLILCTGSPIAVFCLGSSLKGYSFSGQMFWMFLMVAPPVAGLSLSTMIPLLRHGNLTMRSLTTIAFGIAFLAFMSLATIVLFSNWTGRLDWSESAQSAILAAPILLVATLLPISFMILLSLQTTLSLRERLLGWIPIVILIALLLQLSQGTLPGNINIWDEVLHNGIMVMGLVFGVTQVGIALSNWRRWVLTEATGKKLELPRLSIIAIMELTFLVAIYCSMISAAQLSTGDSIAFAVFAALGVIPGGITFGWLLMLLGHQAKLKYFRMVALFLISFRHSVACLRYC